MKTAFLFPGQGSQKAGILGILLARDPHAALVSATVERILKKSIVELDSAEGLQSTVHVQLSLLIAGVLSARQLMARGIWVDYVAGHSVGAVAAAVIAEVISFEQALHLVDNRARLMEQAFPTDYGMAALVGFTESRLAPYLQNHNTDHPPVYLSNSNASDQLVVAGKLSSLTVLMEDLEKAGIQKAKILQVKVPSHCVLMEPVADFMREEIGKLELKNPRIPYASNVSGRALKTGDAVGEDLWRSIASTVKWYDATTLLYELGARLFIEMEPSGVLAKIAASSFPQAEVLNTSQRHPDELALMWHNYEQMKY